MSTSGSAWGSRQAGLQRLREFTARMGSHYQRRRNIDSGTLPGMSPEHVSGLSPYVRHRLVLEEELVRAALNHHGPRDAEKFIEEVFWRGYFRGWLKQRPGVWTAYRQGLEEDRKALQYDAVLDQRVQAACEGRTGLTCFDAWAQELVETGYLHNHTRMWMASIWVFTLQLPWRLGADWFYRHLLDGDPASNTLSWRWVAGLHTRGKAYWADADNIQRCTQGRFAPRPEQLARPGQDLSATEPQGWPDLEPLTPADSLLADISKSNAFTGLLITEEDAHPEDWPIQHLQVNACAVLASAKRRSMLPPSDLVGNFEQAALWDAAKRSGKPAVDLTDASASQWVAWSQSHGISQWLVPDTPPGPIQERLSQLQPVLAAAGLQLRRWRRPWDAAVWPYATAGFFKVRQRIPMVLQALRLL